MASKLVPAVFLVDARFFFYLQNRQRILGSILRARFRSVLAHLDRGLEYGPDGENSSQLVRGYGGQSHGGDTSAGRAIGISAELTRSDLCLKVCRQRLGRERKNTILGVVR